MLFFQKRKPGTVVKTEAELQADIDAYEAARPKVGYSSGSYSSYGASPSLSELD